MEIPIKRFDTSVALPAYEPGAACFDLFCRQTTTIEPHSIAAVPLNIALKVPKGHALLLFVRSSTPMRKGLMLANSVGVVDPFYCGDNDENFAFMYNFTNDPVTVDSGDKVVQGMIIKTEPVAWKEVASMQDDGHGGYQHIDDLKQARKQ